MATGNTLIIFGAQNFQQPATNFAFLGSRNSHPIISFADSGTPAALFSGIIPRHYANGGIVATVIWAAATSVTLTHVVRWGVTFERQEEAGTDIDADSFATEKTVDDNPVGTSGALIYTTLSFTNSELDGIIAGEAFRLRVRRLNSGVTSNMTGAAQLSFVELREA